MARETREAWARRIRRWEKSGLSGAEFAAKEGVKEKTLSFWRWKLGRSSLPKPKRAVRPRKQAPVAFVEVVAEDKASPKTPIEVVIERQRVRISCGGDAALDRVLDALKGFE